MPQPQMSAYAQQKRYRWHQLMLAAHLVHHTRVTRRDVWLSLALLSKPVKQQEHDARNPIPPPDLLR